MGNNARNYSDMSPLARALGARAISGPVIGGQSYILYVACAPVPVVPAGYYSGRDPDTAEGSVQALDRPCVDAYGIGFFVQHPEPVLAPGSLNYDHISLP